MDLLPTGEGERPRGQSARPLGGVGGAYLRDRRRLKNNVEKEDKRDVPISRTPVWKLVAAREQKRR